MPVMKKVLMVTGNLPDGFIIPVITFTAERCMASSF